MRRLAVEFGAEVRFTYVMGGMREFAAGEAFAGEWLDAAAASDMPVDPRMWLDGSAPDGSYPACLAVKAAAEQGDPGRYLRRLREGFAYEGRRLDSVDAFSAVAREVGLDVERFTIDIRSNAITEEFGKDLDRVRAVPESHYAKDATRVELPSIEFRPADGSEAVHGVYGPQDWEAYRGAALAAGAGAVAAGASAPSIEEALRRFGTMATPELAAVCSLPGPRAAAELWRLAEAWAVRPERRLGGEVWSLA